MAIIDGKGRLFGLINIIDLLVIMLIAGAGFSILTNLPLEVRNRKTTEEVYVKVLCRLPDEVVSNKKVLKPGDLILGGNAKIDKVLSVKAIQDAESGGTGYSVVEVLIKASCVVLNDEYYCANMPIKINANIVFSNPFYVIGSTTLDSSIATIVDLYKVPGKDDLLEGGAHG